MVIMRDNSVLVIKMLVWIGSVEADENAMF